MKNFLQVKILLIRKKKLKKFNSDKLREECGVFGISNYIDASALVALGLHALQHRGQEGCGIVTFNGKQYFSEETYEKILPKDLKHYFPNITYLEETYYHRINPNNGFGFQRVFSEDGSIDQSICFNDGDVVLVPKGHHPCGIPYGYELYYLNVMAGPIRKWRFKNHPDFEWLYHRDQK